MLLTDARVQYNTAGESGGAFKVGFSITSRLVLAKGSSLSHNQARDYGGAVSTGTGLGLLELREASSVVNNTAAVHNGGALFSDREVLNITLSGKSTLSSNVAGGCSTIQVPLDRFTVCTIKAEDRRAA
jgi:hypothetical protein